MLWTDFGRQGVEPSEVLVILAERLRIVKLAESVEPVWLESGLTLSGTTIRIVKKFAHGGMGAPQKRTEILLVIR